MGMNLRSFRTKRWIFAWVQAAVIAGLPFLRVNGESALRFDIPTLKLYFFGSVIWISEAYFFLLVFLFFATAVMLFTVIYGRIWCGWACPQTVLSEFAGRIDRIALWMGLHPVLRRFLSHLLLVLFSCFVALTLVWYFISPYDLAAESVAGAVGPWTFWSWVFFSSLIYLDLAFVRHRFCSVVCPYARFQSAFFDDRTLTIGFERSRENECLGCEACIRACPAGVDIRKGLQVECINCAECIDACSTQMQRKHRSPLVRYLRGMSGRESAGRMRPRVFWLSALVAVLSVLLVYQIWVRIPVGFWVLRDESQPYHQAGIRGNLLNAYNIIIENRSLEPGTYELSVSGIKDAELVVSANPLRLPANSMVKMRVYVFALRRNVVDRITQLHFTLRAAGSRELQVSQEAPFLYPERSDKGVDI
jgi:cytochrome c oxidase accessory protein FixG